MATTATPYGLRPVKRADGLPYAGAVTHYLIAPAGIAENIFYGSVVKTLATGYISLALGTGKDLTTNNLGGSSLTALGVFVGCEYVNDMGQTVQSQYYPSGTTGVITAMIVDDPGVLFQCQMAAVSGQDDVFSVCAFVAGQHATTSGSTTTGNSNHPMDATVQTTTGAFKFVGFVSPTDDAYPDILVKFNPGYHAYNTAVGI
jgi:hypothetical protein